MTIKHSAAIAAIAMIWSVGAWAQDPPPPTEAQAAPAETPTATGSEWWVFSRAPNRHYLIDVNSVARTGDELTVDVARVSTETPAGDYSHSVDQFGIECRGRRSHVVTSRDAFAEGVLEEAYATDEPWEAISARSFDDGIREISCDDMRPQPPSWPSIKAYIDAGRP
jgi:hypothetical protein